MAHNKRGILFFAQCYNLNNLKNKINLLLKPDFEIKPLDTTVNIYIES